MGLIHGLNTHPPPLEVLPLGNLRDLTIPLPPPSHPPPPPDRAFLLFARFWRSRERLCVKWVRSMLTTCCILLRNTFEPKPNNCALDTAVLCYENWLINKRMLAQDDRKQGWLVQKFGLRRLQRFDMIQAEPPFLLPSQHTQGKVRHFFNMKLSTWKAVERNFIY